MNKRREKPPEYYDTTVRLYVDGSGAVRQRQGACRHIKSNPSRRDPFLLLSIAKKAAIFEYIKTNVIEKFLSIVI
jgi:hypothetical protein